MATTVEVLRARSQSPSGESMMWSVAQAARAIGDRVVETEELRGKSEWLVLFGIGAAVNDEARRAQITRGGRVLHWDLGYIDRKKLVGHLRMSIDSDHPQQWLDRTPVDAARWRRLGVALREDADPAGPILLIGLGRKSRAYLNEPEWERRTYQQLLRRFPGRRIVFRPKGIDDIRLPCRADVQTPIGELLRGASLVVCRHSNVGVDAVVAGVPFEAEDGAACWLKGKPYTPGVRLEFLQRLAWWQWKSKEAPEAWAFAKEVVTR